MLTLHKRAKDRQGRELQRQKDCPRLPTGSNGTVLCYKGLAGGAGTMAPLALPTEPFVMLLGNHVAAKCLISGKLIGDF